MVVVQDLSCFVLQGVIGVLPCCMKSFIEVVVCVVS